MQKVILASLLLAFINIQASLPHEFHVSKCQIEYKEAEQAIQVSMQIFIDDLELALEKKGHKSLFLGSEKEVADVDNYLLNYLEKTFEIQINNTVATPTFIGRETSEDLTSLWCYFEITDVTEINKVSVKNSTLTEIYDDQKNIIKIKGPDNKKGYFLLDKTNQSQSLEFKD